MKQFTLTGIDDKTFNLKFRTLKDMMNFVKIYLEAKE